MSVVTTFTWLSCIWVALSSVSTTCYDGFERRSKWVSKSAAGCPGSRARSSVQEAVDRAVRLNRLLRPQFTWRLLGDRLGPHGRFMPWVTCTPEVEKTLPPPVIWPATEPPA